MELLPVGDCLEPMCNTDRKTVGWLCHAHFILVFDYICGVATISYGFSSTRSLCVFGFRLPFVVVCEAIESFAVCTIVFVSLLVPISGCRWLFARDPKLCS